MQYFVRGRWLRIVGVPRWLIKRKIKKQITRAYTQNKNDHIIVEVHCSYDNAFLQCFVSIANICSMLCDYGFKDHFTLLVTVRSFNAYENKKSFLFLFLIISNFRVVELDRVGLRLDISMGWSGILRPHPCHLFLLYSYYNFHFLFAENDSIQIFSTFKSKSKIYILVIRKKFKHSLQ